MSIRKTYIRRKDICRVEFTVPSKVGKTAEVIQVLGDFNRWSYCTPPMKKTKDGRHVSVQELPLNKTYQFRYLVNGSVWMNDKEADQLIPSNEKQLFNSLIIL